MPMNAPLDDEDLENAIYGTLSRLPKDLPKTEETREAIGKLVAGIEAAFAAEKASGR
jgi:hypothetical protein